MTATPANCFAFLFERIIAAYRYEDKIKLLNLEDSFARLLRDIPNRRANIAMFVARVKRESDESKSRGFVVVMKELAHLPIAAQSNRKEQLYSSKLALTETRRMSLVK